MKFLEIWSDNEVLKSYLNYSFPIFIFWGPVWNSLCVWGCPRIPGLLTSMSQALGFQWFCTVPYCDRDWVQWLLHAKQLKYQMSQHLQVHFKIIPFLKCLFYSFEHNLYRCAPSLISLLSLLGSCSNNHPLQWWVP